MAKESTYKTELKKQRLDCNNYLNPKKCDPWIIEADRTKFVAKDVNPPITPSWTQEDIEKASRICQECKNFEKN